MIKIFVYEIWRQRDGGFVKGFLEKSYHFVVHILTFGKALLSSANSLFISVLNFYASVFTEA